MAIGKTFIQILGPREQYPNNPGFPTIFLQKQVDTTRTVFGFSDGNGNTFSTMLILAKGNASGTKLNRIFDVNAPSPNNGDTLVYNSVTQKWVNGAGGGGGSPFTSLSATTMSGGTIYSGSTELSQVFDYKLDKDVNINSQSGTSYSLLLTDRGKLIEMARATAMTLTVPLNSAVAFPIGAQILVYQAAAGQVTFSGMTGVSLISSGNKNKTGAQYATASLIKTATNTWLLSGDLTT